ncbi:MAG: hypothetical protein J5895_05440 [Alphaproteobacteria bacterium]|nr:hypothetical protein [Alphaproteobacteria bacterium]
MDISEHIYTCAAFKVNAEKLTELKAFFSDFPIKDAQDWPMCATKKNGEPRYARVQVQGDRFGFEKALYLAFECEAGNAKYMIAQKLKYDDALQIELDCIRRTNQKEKTTSRFIFHLMEQYSRFLKQFAFKSGAKKEETYLKLEAHSGVADGFRTNGGYVWATHRFDFENEDELVRTREAFKEYALKNGVEIEEKDLRLFQYPCHFAAFRTNKKIDGQNLGKAFLLQYSWQGKMTAAMSEKCEIARYERTFYKQNKLEAEKELSTRFLKMMKKYNKSNNAKMNIFMRLFENKKLRVR